MQFELFAKAVGKVRDDAGLEICAISDDPDSIDLNFFDRVKQYKQAYNYCQLEIRMGTLVRTQAHGHRHRAAAVARAGVQVKNKYISL